MLQFSARAPEGTHRRVGASVLRSRARGRASTVALSLLVSLTCSGCSASASSAQPSAESNTGSAALAAPNCPRVERATREGEIAFAEVDEASGAVASRKNPSVFWLHNDSGDEARAFAIDLHGRALAELKLTNARARDVEDIALAHGVGDAPDVLYLADTGDNWKRRDSVRLYRVEEPKLDLTRERVVFNRDVEVIEVTYEDGRHDAESLLIDPVLGDAYLVAKSHFLLREEQVGVYRVPAALLRAGKVVAHKVATVPLGPSTAGDVKPDGSGIAVRNYWSALYWPRAPGETFAHALAKPGCRLPMPDISHQGESFAFTADGSAYVTIPEGRHAPIFRSVFAR